MGRLCQGFWLKVIPKEKPGKSRACWSVVASPRVSGVFKGIPERVRAMLGPSPVSPAVCNVNPNGVFNGVGPPPRVRGLSFSFDVHYAELLPTDPFGIRLLPGH